MYAVIETGGKQYTVKQGDVINIERIEGDAGKTITFDKVLLVAGKAGAPYVKGASVTAEYVDEVLAPKVIIFKMKRRKRYRRFRGHRQINTKVKITGITA